MALNFPAKIYQILENESSDIIRWHPNGLAFRIVDHGRFEREIIPKYFRHNQLSSVQRQLNLYGFKCVSRGEDKGAFYHPKFKRGDWEVVKKITRYSPPKKVMDGPFSERPCDDIKQEDCTLNGQMYSGHQYAAVNDSAYSAQAYFHPGYPHPHPSFIDASSVGTQATWAAWPSASAVFVPSMAYTVDMPNAHHFLPFHLHHSAAMNFPPVQTNEEVEFHSFSASSTASDLVTEQTTQATQASNSSTPTAAAAVPLPGKPYVKVVKDVVMIDPDFDLDAEFDMFSDMELPGHQSSLSPTMDSTSPMPVEKRDMAVNTDLTLPVDAVIGF